MKKRVLWRGLIILMAVAFVLASCKKAPGGRAGKAEEDVPQYGGTLTHLPSFFNYLTESWDPFDSTTGAIIPWCQPVMEEAYEGDIEKYGAQGSGEYLFNSIELTEEKYLRGKTCESWEWRDPLTLVFHVRPGVFFSGQSVNPGVMERRELVAEDFAYHVNRMKTCQIGMLWDFVKSTYADDKYTWVVEFEKYYSDWVWWLGFAFIQVYPHEVVEAGASDWRNLVGTGPFIMADYVRGSQATYTRNPDYWGKVTIDGKEYQTPFIDKLIFAIIPDEATQVASLRTGRIDWATTISTKYKDTLAETAAELKRWEWANYASATVVFQCRTSEYFDDVNVRRAMFIGTDFQAIADSAWGPGNADINPLGAAESLYIPMEELPESITELYNTYDPEKAKQMLSDAGYPDGFDIEMTYSPEQVQYSAEDIASMIVDQWAGIGVNVTLKPIETTVMLRLSRSHEFTDSILTNRAIRPTSIVMGQGLYGNIENYSEWQDEQFTTWYNEAFSERDPVKALATKKDMILRYLDAAPEMPTARIYMQSYAWPWIKNYHGAISGGYHHVMPMVKVMWIDQDLKEEMGY